MISGTNAYRYKMWRLLRTQPGWNQGLYINCPSLMLVYTRNCCLSKLGCIATEQNILRYKNILQKTFLKNIHLCRSAEGQQIHPTPAFLKMCMDHGRCTGVDQERFKMFWNQISWSKDCLAPFTHIHVYIQDWERFEEIYHLAPKVFLQN